MPSKIPSIIGKILYGAIFILLLPALLVLWAKMTEEHIPLPAVESFSLGGIIAIIGAVIMISGMYAIIVYGNGLPMNAYPPARFVSESIYSILSHPIYTGFSLLCFGLAIATGSASGLWLVSPCVAVGCAALVQGYEKRATIKHFGPIDSHPFIHLPVRGDSSPSVSDRISCYLFAIVPWLIFIGAARSIDAPTILLSGKDFLPASPSAAAASLGSLLVILFVPLLMCKSGHLRGFILSALAVTVIAGFLFIAPLYERFEVASQASQTGMLFVAAIFYARTWYRARVAVYAIAFLVCLIGLLTGTLSVPGFLAGIAVFVLAARIKDVWEFLRAATQYLANSWKEWRYGPARIINHGVYAALGAFVSLSIIGNVVGPANLGYVILTAFLAIIMAALSAQWIEGGTVSLRPYGWYGGVVGAFAGGALSYAAGVDLWLLAGGFCLGAPWVQAMGRLRCLVQGCCHGYETGTVVGITYRHPVSRVCRLSKLGGVPLHPAPLYSIICNSIVAIILARLWLSHASLALIIGLYFILTGFGRFVEESYRGEQQTPQFGALRLYQIFAILSVAGGIGVTMLGGRSGPAPDLRLNIEAVILSAIFGCFAFFAFGVDFPNSSRRFARLT